MSIIYPPFWLEIKVEEKHICWVNKFVVIIIWYGIKNMQ